MPQGHLCMIKQNRKQKCAALWQNCARSSMPRLYTYKKHRGDGLLNPRHAFNGRARVNDRSGSSIGRCTFRTIMFMHVWWMIADYYAVAIWGQHFDFCTNARKIDQNFVHLFPERCRIRNCHTLLEVKAISFFISVCFVVAVGCFVKWVLLEWTTASGHQLRI